MYARLVTTHMKPGKFDVATRMFEDKVIPMLKKQKGFKDELSFFDKEHLENVAISFWDTEADAIEYEKSLYPRVLDTLRETFEGKPEVKRFEVANATWYKIHAA